jgi:hypothetical protein
MLNVIPYTKNWQDGFCLSDIIWKILPL